MSVSIYDIAKKARVSPSTVSRALQDHPRIGAITKKRIQELAKEMGYVPNTVAKSLVADQTWTIGIELAAISDPFMGRVVEGVEQAAIEAGGPSFALALDAFIATLEGNETTYPSLMDGLRAQMIAEAAVESLHRNQPVKITYWQPQ